MIWLIVLAAVSLYFFAIGRLAVNFPFWDDYNAVLETILTLQATDSYSEKLRIVTSQHNEHRIVFAKVVEFLLFKLQGRIDFQSLIYAGNFGLVVLSAVMVAGARRISASPAILAIAPLLMFTPLQSADMIWAMACLTNLWALAFAALSLLLLTRPGITSFCGAGLLAVLATYTCGQGIICFIPGLLALTLQKRWRATLVWLVIFAVTALAYFHGYTKPAHHPPLEISLRSALFVPIMAGGAVSAPLYILVKPFINLFAFGGGRALLFLRVLVGLGVLGSVLYVWLTGYYRRNLFMAVLLAYLVILCGAAAVSRAGFGLEHATNHHYHSVSLPLAIALAFVALDLKAKRTPGSPLSRWALGGALFANLFLWHAFLPEVKAFSDEVTESRNLFLKTQDSKAVAWDPAQEYGADLLWQSYLSGNLPLRDLDFSHAVTISSERLKRITKPMEPNQASNPKKPRDVRVTAIVKERGDDLELFPAEDTAEFPVSPGRVALLDGKLFYFPPLK